jgi:hypothetical protein
MGWLGDFTYFRYVGLNGKAHRMGTVLPEEYTIRTNLRIKLFSKFNLNKYKCNTQASNSNFFIHEHKISKFIKINM